jgi:hypothetical protein
VKKDDPLILSYDLHGERSEAKRGKRLFPWFNAARTIRWSCIRVAADIPPASSASYQRSRSRVVSFETSTSPSGLALMRAVSARLCNKKDQFRGCSSVVRAGDS